jgi:hypothetical protein
MKSTEVTVFDRKSGGAEGPAVRRGSRTKVSVPLVPPQNRHPERSASQMDRVTQRLWRVAEEPVLSGAEGTSAVLILPMLLAAFRPPKADNRICCDTHLVVTAHLAMHAQASSHFFIGAPQHLPHRRNHIGIVDAQISIAHHARIMVRNQRGTTAYLPQ